MTTFTESLVEEAALDWLGAIGCAVVFGPTIAPGELGAERSTCQQVLLEGRSREVFERLNPGVPSEAIDQVFRKLTRNSSPQLIDAHHEVHCDIASASFASTATRWTSRKERRIRCRRRRSCCRSVGRRQSRDRVT